MSIPEEVREGLLEDPEVIGAEAVERVLGCSLNFTLSRDSVSP